jgi:lipopolysaccharide export system protein LptA
MTPARPLRPLLIALALASLAAFGASAQDGPALFGGLAANEGQPIQIEAESLEVFEEGPTRISSFEGNVVARQGDTLIKAARITVFAPLAGGEGILADSSFDRIEAEGSVSFTSPDQTATGDRGIVDMRSRTITLTGNVVVTDGSTVLTGARLTIDMDTGRAQVDRSAEGRIRALITPGARPQ